jgi:hypothetical protein
LQDKAIDESDGETQVATPVAQATHLPVVFDK